MSKRREKKIEDETEAKFAYEIEWHHLARQRRRDRYMDEFVAKWERDFPVEIARLIADEKTQG